MPLSHRCCISSFSVFIAPLFAKVIRVNCNLKYALAVWCLPAHGVGRIFFITVMVFGHYPIATRLWRDYDAIRFLTTRLHLAYSQVPYLVGRLAAKELHGASLISLAITLNPSRMSVKCVIGIWVRASAWKCAEVRERSARICFDRLLLLCSLYLLKVSRAREENTAHSECGLGSVQLFRCYLRTYIQRQLALLLLP